MASFYNNNQQQLLEEADRHVDREDFIATQSISSGKWIKTSKTNDFIPSISFQFDLILTMTLKDDAGRHEFKGQCITNMTPSLKASILKGKPKEREGKVIRVTKELGQLEILPLDKSNKQAVRLDTGRDEDKEYSGKLTVELITFSNVDTKSGFIEEMLTSVVKGAKKKWWALLYTQGIPGVHGGGRFLYLFSKQGDKKEREKIQITHSSQVEFNKRAGYIKVASIDRTFLLTHSSADERSDWYMKMSGKYLDILEEGKRRYLSQFEDKEEGKEEEGKGREEEEKDWGEEGKDEFKEEGKE